MKPQGPLAAARSAGRATGGTSVQLIGVVHLYSQRGADVVALRSVDLDIDAGEMVALLGPSGMGKTTVLRLMAGIIRASAGVVRVAERDLRELSPSQRRAFRACEVGYVVQGTGANLLPFATAAQNVWFAQNGARARGHVPPWRPEDLLEMLDLTHTKGTPVGELPRGLQQQVALAAGVSPGPRLLLADEPTSQLDEDSSLDVVHLLQRINGEFGTTVVLVTHDPVVAGCFPRTVTIRDGRVGAEGRHGRDYAVVDGSGSIQLPPHVLRVLPPATRVLVIEGPNGVELRRTELDP